MAGGRKKKADKAAALADLAEGVAPETVMEKHGIKSRRTLESWTKAAKEAEGKSGAGEPPPPDPTQPTDTSEGVHMGEAEMLVTIVEWGTSFTTKTAGMCVGFAPTSPVVASLSRLSDDERAMLRTCAPSLLPVWSKLCKWMEKHPVVVFSLLFGSMMLPRMVTLGMAAKQIRKREKEAAAAANRPHRMSTETNRAESGPPPNRDAPVNGAGSVRLYPEGEEP